MDTKKKITDINLLAPMMLETLSRGGSVRIIVTGNSMYPTLHSRIDTVVLSPADQLKKIKKYDITFHRRPDGRYILHRVVGINRDGTYRIAGDNEIKPEPPVSREQIFGVVTEFTRRGKTCSVKNPVYRLFVMLWCLVMPWRYHIIGIWLKIRRRGKEAAQ